MERNGVVNTILFFASARGKSFPAHKKSTEEVSAKLAESGLDDAVRAKAQSDLKRLERTAWMCPYYDKVRDLSRRLSQWA